MPTFPTLCKPYATQTLTIPMLCISFLYRPFLRYANLSYAMNALPVIFKPFLCYANTPHAMEPLPMLYKPLLCHANTSFEMTSLRYLKPFLLYVNSFHYTQTPPIPCKPFLHYANPSHTLYANQIEFREDLKILFEKAAVGGKPITFLFNDNQVRPGFAPVSYRYPGPWRILMTLCRT